MNFQTVCALSGWDDGVAYAFPHLPNEDISASDQIYCNPADDFGVITFTGAPAFLILFSCRLSAEAGNRHSSVRCEQG